jgi:hypothetical protein
VELVYDGQLLQFMDKVPCGLLIEDGALVHEASYVTIGEKYALLRSSIGLQNSPDLNPLENLWKVWSNMARHALET